MSEQIEARRLSGSDLGRTLTLPDGVQGVVTYVGQMSDRVTCDLARGGDETVHHLAPSDLVTVTGRGQS